jgi:ribosome biogenesis ATPase
MTDKLIHRLTDYIAKSPPLTVHTNQAGLDKAVAFILKTHREYQRKPQKAFRDSIKTGLEICINGVTSPTLTEGDTGSEDGNGEHAAQQNETTEGADTQMSDGEATNNSKKRQRHPSQDTPSDEEVADRRAEKSMAAAGSNMMNSGMRATYIKQPKKIVAASDDGPPQSTLQANATTPKKKPGNTPKKNAPKNNDDSGGFGGFGGGSSTPINALCERPTTRYSDIGGVEPILQSVRELIEYPLAHPEIYTHIGVEPPRGILLHGPPGCGKTLLANAMAGQLGVAFLKISAPEIVSGMSGESEQKVREIFQAAIDNAPAILFIDEVDAIMSKRDSNARGMEKRIVAQLLTCMDGLSMENTNNKPVMVIGATNRPDSLDSALRRAGRFDREICMGVPDQASRERILRVMTTKMRLDGEFDFLSIAKLTPGYVGADIRSLTKEAAVIAINRIFKDVLKLDHVGVSVEANGDAAEGVMTAVAPSPAPLLAQAVDGGISSGSPLTSEQLDPLSVTMSDFLAAVRIVQPSSKREGFATVPDVSWKDIGALGAIREELTLSILEPIANPERFEQLGLSMPAGVLLYGPPGCGKTLLAKAIANESGANFISVKGPELLDKYIGESERAVRQVFERARASSPCVVFFDELDSLCARRGGASGESGGGVSDRVVNQLLTELDGADSRKSVFVIAATNRPELIDPAMLRPGRLDKLLYIPLPSPDDRASILVSLCKKAKLADGIDLAAMAKSDKGNGFSGADLAALLREAGLACLKEAGNVPKGTKLLIQKRHFENAFNNVMPSVSAEDQKTYDDIRDRMSRARSRG